jgi:hypothetical protein
MKKIALISSFCNTQDKLDVLLNNIEILKKLSVDVCLLTPFYIPKEIIELCDYVIISKENPIFRTNIVWKYYNYKISTKHTVIYEDYGYASLNQIKRLFQFGSTLDYEVYYQMIYDLKIDDKVCEIINNNQFNYFFSNKREDSKDFFNVGGVLGIFDKENIIKISENITESEYNNFLMAETYYEEIQKRTGLPVHEYITTDLIYNNDNSIFNLSKSKKLKFFIDKIQKKNGILIIHFFGVKEYSDVKITINGKEVEFIIEEDKFLIHKFHTIENLLIQIDSEIHDFTNFYNSNNFPIPEIKIDEQNDLTYVLNKIVENNMHIIFE